MNNRLEQFVRDNREDFDGEEPAKKIWENLQRDLNLPKQDDKPKGGAAPIIRITRTWLSVAAAVLVLAGGIFYFGSRHNENMGAAGQGNIALTRPGTKPADTASTTPTVTEEQEQPNPQLADATPKEKEKKSVVPEKPKDRLTEQQDAMNEEMYHYTRLVELKHKELKAIEKDEPMLYRQFASDVHKLDSVYQGLRKELPKNPNREQLLEAMIQNLQLQMGLLNHQLDIIKQINHSKQKAYEKAVKTI